MSKKIDGEFLKNLIKEAMKEQQLNEKTYSFKGGWKDLYGKPISDIDSDAISDIRGKATGPNRLPVKSSVSKQDFIDAANSDGKAALTPDDLNADYDKVYDILNTFVDAETSSYDGKKKKKKKKKSSPPAGHTFSQASTSRNLGANSTTVDYHTAISSEIQNMNKTNALTLEPEIRDLLIDMKSLYLKAPNKNSKYNQLVNDLNRQLNLLAGANPPGPNNPVGQAALGLLNFINKDLKRGSRRYDQLYANPEFQSSNVASTQSTIGGSETQAQLSNTTFTAATESSAAAMASLFGGAAGTEGDLKARMKVISDVVDQFNNIGKVASAVSGMTSIQQSMAFISKMSFITQLFIAGKNAEGTQAGFDFERFCGLIFGGIIAGKGNLAADVVSSAGQGFLRTSQKYVKSPSQIAQNAKNTNDIIFGLGEPLYYIGMIKAGRHGKGSKAPTFSSLDMYVLKIEASGTAKVKVSHLTSAGSFKQSGTLNKATSGSYKYGSTGPDPIELDFGFHKLTSDPQLAIAEFDKKLSQSGGIVEQIHKASRDIYQLATNMLRNTEEYRAVKGGATASISSNPLDYVNQISLDYGELESQYDTLFGLDTTGADKPTQGALKEEKAITANSLKKLFKETLKK